MTTFYWIQQEFKRQLTLLINAWVPNQREWINSPLDYLWIISLILAKSNQNGYGKNQNNRKTKFSLKNWKNSKNSPFWKSRQCFLNWFVFFFFYFSPISPFCQFWWRISSGFLKHEKFSHKNVSLLLRK